MKDVTILVGTLDPYKEAWPMFCHGINKYWPDCPWPIKAATNHLDFPCGEGLKVGVYKNWTRNTMLSLQKIDTPIVFWMLEDTWLTDPPNTKVLKEFTQHILDGKTDYIRLVNSKMVENVGLASFDDRLFVYSDNSRYRTSLCPSIWNRQVFIDLLKDGESIWDFETIGNTRSKGRVFCHTIAYDYIYLQHTYPTKNSGWSSTPIRRGTWTNVAKEYMAREKLSFNLSHNPMTTLNEMRKAQEQVKVSLESLLDYNSDDVEWGTSPGDKYFFEICKNKLKEYPIKTVLDVACGKGEFIVACNNDGFEAYGIDPVNKGNDIYTGTFESLINAKSIPEIDCIAIHNVLHGRGHSRKTILGLFDFFKKYAKYIVITEPDYEKLDLPVLTNQFELLHTFSGSHRGKTAIHKLYKAKKKKK